MPRAILVVPRASGPLSPALKLALGGEILSAYLATRRRLAGASLPEVIALTRRHGRAWDEEAPAPADVLPVVARLASAVQRTMRILPADARCLTQSLVLSALLDARGIPSRLVIGVRCEPAFAAHAWIEYDGLPVLPAHGFERHRLLEI